MLIAVLFLFLTLGQIEAKPIIADPINITKYWTTITSKNFRLHIPTSKINDGKRYILFFEKVHKEIQQHYGHDTHHLPTNVVLKYTSDPVAGEVLGSDFSGPGPNTTVITMFPVVQGHEISYYDNYFKLVFIHEYAHVLSLRTSGPKYPGLRTFRVLFAAPKTLYPRGITEGIATWQEGQYTAGRLTGSIAKMFIRTSVVENAYPTLSEVVYGDTHRFPWTGGYAYIWGAQMFLQLELDRGKNSIHTFWNSDSLILPSLAFRDTGTKIRTNYKNMKNRHFREYQASAQKIQKIPLTKYRQITFSGGYKGFLTLTPDKQLIYLAQNVIGQKKSGYYRLDPTRTSKKQKKPKFLFETSFASRGIALNDKYFLASRSYEIANTGVRYGNNVRLELFDAKKGYLSGRLSKNRYIYFPALSDSGNRLYFVERDHDHLYLKTTLLDDNDLRLPATKYGDPRLQNLSKAKLKKQIFYRAPEHPEEETILKLPMDGFLEYVVAHPKNPNIVAALVRASSEKGNGNIVLCTRSAPALGSAYNCRAIIGGKSKKTELSFSANGDRILFAADPDGVFNIYSYSLKSKKIIRLTNTLTGFFFPQLAAKGLYAFHYGKDGYDVVFIRNQDLERITASGFTVNQSLAQDLSQQRIYQRKLSLEIKGLEEQWQQQNLRKLVKNRTVGDDLPDNYFYAEKYKPYSNGYLSGLIATLANQALSVSFRDPLNKHLFNIIFGAIRPYTASLGAGSLFWFGFRYANQVRPTNFIWGHDQIATNFSAPGDISYTADRFVGVHSYKFNDHVHTFAIGQQYEKNHTARNTLQNQLLGITFYERTTTFFNWLVDNTTRFPGSISPELGYRFNLGFEYNIAHPLSVNPTNIRLIEPSGDGNSYEANLLLFYGYYLPGARRYHVNYLSGEIVSSLNNNQRQQYYLSYEYRLPLAILSYDLAEKTNADPGLLRVNSIALRFQLRHYSTFVLNNFVPAHQSSFNTITVIFSMLLGVHIATVPVQFNIFMTRAPSNIRNLFLTNVFNVSDTRQGPRLQNSSSIVDPYEYRLGFEIAFSLGDTLKNDPSNVADRPAITRTIQNAPYTYEDRSDSANGFVHSNEAF